jgi:hypothetical protein
MGIYYRALVGPFASAERPQKLCSGLKGAGGDCLVQKNWRFAAGSDHPTAEEVKPASKGLIATCPSRSSLRLPKLLMPNTVRTVADILALPEWHGEQLRLVVEHWQPAAEVRIERMR